MLAQKGHQVTVFVNDRKVKSFEIENSSEGRIIRFNPAFFNKSYFLGETTQLAFAFAMMVEKIIVSGEKPDIIESQDYNGIAYFLLQKKACLFDWCRDIPVIITMHAPSFLYMEYNQVPLYQRPNFWIGEMERFSIVAADLVISPSHYLIEELKKRCRMDHLNLHVIPNPWTFPIKEKYSISTTSTNNHLAFYGKLSPQKGVFRILEEFKVLWDKGLKESFTMIGGQDIVFAPAAKTMGAIVKQQYKSYLKLNLLRLKNKIILSKETDSFSAYDIFIIPSIVDNLPYVVLELMSLGKILIVSHQGGQAEIVSDQVNGFIFDYRYPGSFETVLNRVLQLAIKERVTLSQQAKSRAMDYSYDKIYEKKIAAIDALRSKKRAPLFPLIRPLPIKATLQYEQSVHGTLLTVIIPYYNLGKYIQKTVESIQRSTYKNLEIFIVNDGSSEEQSIKKLDTYRHSERITVFDKKNTGLADTRNYGADIAKGRFLAFLDADDTIEPTYYEKAITILNQYENVHFVGAWARYTDGSAAIWPTFNPEPPLLLNHNMINSSALVYKRESFLASGKNNTHFKIGLEDYESVIHLKANGFNGVAIPEILFNYRVRKNSMIKGVNKQVRAFYYHDIATLHQPFFAMYEKEVQLLTEWNGSPLSWDNDTLDNLPFEKVPKLNAIIRKIVFFIKSSRILKEGALQIKRLVKRQ